MGMAARYKTFGLSANTASAAAAAGTEPSQRRTPANRRQPARKKQAAAGIAIPAAACFFLAGCLLFAGVRRWLGSVPAAAAALAVFALNPNVLYLAAIPMTEPFFFAALFGMFYFCACFRDTQSWLSVLGAAIASCAASLTRY